MNPLTKSQGGPDLVGTKTSNRGLGWELEAPCEAVPREAAEDQSLLRPSKRRPLKIHVPLQCEETKGLYDKAQKSLLYRLKPNELTSRKIRRNLPIQAKVELLNVSFILFALRERTISCSNALQEGKSSRKYENVINSVLRSHRDGGSMASYLVKTYAKHCLKSIKEAKCFLKELLPVESMGLLSSPVRGRPNPQSRGFKSRRVSSELACL